MVDRYRNYKPRKQIRKTSRKKHKAIYVLPLLLLVFFGIKTFFSGTQTNEKSDTKLSSAPKPKATPKAEPISSTTWADLRQKVSAIINENEAIDISVAVIDLNSNTTANFGIQDNFAGASTTKVLTAAAYLHDVESGKRSLEETISGASAEVQVRRMINQSNNTSWEVLNTAVENARLESYAHEHGLSSYKYYGNLITSNDQAQLLSKLYKRQLLNDAHTKLLLSFMQNTNNEEMIPVVKPVNATLYHKYGQLEDRLHDGAIINYKNKPIVLVIYTKGGAGDGSNYGSRIKLVQELSSSVINTLYADN